MIRTYFLKTKRIDGVDTCDGMEFIHDALLTTEGELRKLIQDTTDTEHKGLIKVADNWRETDKEEIAIFQKMPKPSEGRNLVAEIDELKARLDSLKA